MIGRLLAIWVIATLAAQSAAETRIYRSVDENGNVVFSDKPPENRAAQPVEVEQANTFSDSSQRTSSNGRQLWIVDENGSEVAEAAPSYRSLSIISPTADEAIRANDGALQVRIDLQPELAPTHTVQLSFDGSVEAEGTGSIFNLTNVDELFDVLQKPKRRNYVFMCTCRK